PFIVGGLLKSALGAATLKLFSTYGAEPRDRSSKTQ
ncbi:MAG: biotin transporter BioY, partial [Mesorhizobium sp.]